MTLTAGKNTAEFLLTEGDGFYSRERITIASEAGALVAGTILGKVTATGEYRAYDNADSPAGIGVAAGILYANVPDSTADQKATAIVRHAEVSEAELTGLDAGARADLAALGIVIR